MKHLFILNDPPYGTERSFNGLRLAFSVAQRADEQVFVFLIGDAASCAKQGQKVPQGYYNIEIMIKNVIRKGGIIGVCGTCLEARGISDNEMIEGAEKSSMNILTNWTVESDHVLIF